MNKNAIQKFAIWARNELIAQVSQRAYQYGIDESGFGDASAGNPKGVMLTARNFSWNVEAFQTHIPYCVGDNYVSILPYAHIFGLTCDLITPMCTGMHTIILGRLPIPSVVVEIMQAYSPKIFFAVPLVLAKMVEYVVVGRPSDDCQIAGAERPLSLKDRASRCLTDIGIE